MKDTLRESVDRAARVAAQLLALADLDRPLKDAGEPLDLAALAEMAVTERAWTFWPTAERSCL